MADEKISQLPDMSALTGTEFLTGLQGGANGNATPAQIKAYIGAQKQNSASSDPAVTNDNTQGYDIGSSWLNTITDISWVCQDASTDAAIWARQSRFRRRNFRSGFYYAALAGCTAGASASGGNVSISMIPFEIEETITISELGGFVTTAAASGNFMLAIYANNYAIGRPTGTPLASVVNLSTAAATVVSKALAANVTLQPGIYWIASQIDNATALLQSIATANLHATAWIGSATLTHMGGAATAAVLELRVTNTYANGFPDMSSATIIESVGTYMAASINFKVA